MPLTHSDKTLTTRDSDVVDVGAANKRDHSEYDHGAKSNKRPFLDDYESDNQTTDAAVSMSMQQRMADDERRYGRAALRG